MLVRPGSGRRGAGAARLTAQGTKQAGFEARPRPGRAQLYRPRRVEVVDRLAAERLLPAIYFVFSRAGCDESVRHCLDDGLRLTTPQERHRIRAIVESYVDPLTDEDLAVLGYRDLRGRPRGGRGGASRRDGAAVSGGGRGVLRRGARQGRLRHRDLRARHQHARALGGHRGGDQVRRQRPPGAHAGRVHPAHGTSGPAGASTTSATRPCCAHRSTPSATSPGSPADDPRALSSSFRPTYNLAVNLVRRHNREAAYTLVSSSFAQFLSEEDLVGELDSVLGVLQRRGYLEGWTVTEAGARLAGLYHEADLLVAEALEVRPARRSRPGQPGRGCLGLLLRGPPGAGGAVACARAPRWPDASRRSRTLSEALSNEETSARLPVTRGVDAGFASLIYDWAGAGTCARSSSRPPARAAGAERAAPLMSGGDFVRNVKQVIDLLRQVAVVAAKPETAKERPGGGRAPAARCGRRLVGRDDPRRARDHPRRRPARPVISSGHVYRRWRDSSPPRSGSCSGGTSQISTAPCSRSSTCPRW